MGRREVLQGMIDAWWPEYLAAQEEAYCPDARSPVLSPSIAEADADGFLRGLENGLFRIESGFVILSELRPRKRDGTLTRYVLFEKVGSTCMLHQENIPHYAAATELILDYGWPG